MALPKPFASDDQAPGDKRRRDIDWYRSVMTLRQAIADTTGHQFTITAHLEPDARVWFSSHGPAGSLDYTEEHERVIQALCDDVGSWLVFS